jgi:hypothetical protein
MNSETNGWLIHLPKSKPAPTWVEKRLEAVRAWWYRNDVCRWAVAAVLTVLCWAVAIGGACLAWKLVHL